MDFASLTYPPYGAPLLEAYGGRFESLYIILHPFVGVPEEFAWQTARQYPGYEEILERGSKRAWAEVAAETGIKSCARMNQALLTSIRSLHDDLCDFAAASALEKYLQSHAVWMPGEGAFEPLLEGDFLQVFAAAGHRELIFVPEFPEADPVERLSVAHLKSRAASFPARGSLVAPDASFLFTVDWDSFFTLFYGPRALVEEAARQRKLEGFFAEATTEHFWFNYSLGCCVVTLAPDGWPAA